MKSFAVIGLGRFGMSVAKTLAAMGCEILAIDSDEHKVQEIAAKVTHAVQADAKDEDVLRALGVQNADVVIVATTQDIQTSILVTVMIKEMGVKTVVVKAKNELHGRVLQKIGADKIVYPERDMGIRVAHNLVSKSIIDYIELSPEYSIVEIAAPQEFFDQSLQELNLRRKYGLNVIAIKRDNEIIVSPQAEEKIIVGDTLIVIGENEKLDKL